MLHSNQKGILCLLLLLLLLLSHFSRVWLCVTPYMAAHRLPRSWDSLGKNTRVGCHFLLQCMKVKSESEVAQSCLTLSDPMDCSPAGSSIHGIFQARTLEWVAIFFSNVWKWKVKVKSLSHAQLLATPWGCFFSLVKFFSSIAISFHRRVQKGAEF